MLYRVLKSKLVEPAVGIGIISDLVENVNCVSAVAVNRVVKRNRVDNAFKRYYDILSFHVNFLSDFAYGRLAHIFCGELFFL